MRGQALDGLVSFYSCFERRRLIHETAIYCVKPIINCSAKRLNEAALGRPALDYSGAIVPAYSAIWPISIDGTTELGRLSTLGPQLDFTLVLVRRFFRAEFYI